MAVAIIITIAGISVAVETIAVEWTYTESLSTDILQLSVTRPVAIARRLVMATLLSGLV